MDAVLPKIEEAAAELLEANGSIKCGYVGKVEAWENENRIKLHWNNWFDVSFQMLFLSCCDRTLIPLCDCAVLRSREALPVVPELRVVFHAHGDHRPLC